MRVKADVQIYIPRKSSHPLLIYYASLCVPHMSMVKMHAIPINNLYVRLL